LIEWYENMNVELFKLKDEPGERHDLAKMQPELAIKLTKFLHDWRRQVDAEMPTLNPACQPAKAESAQNQEP
jgi:hypothetical protein